MNVAILYFLVLATKGSVMEYGEEQGRVGESKEVVRLLPFPLSYHLLASLKEAKGGAVCTGVTLKEDIEAGANGLGGD